MKNILFFAYPQYADFEVAHALFVLRKIGKSTITTVTIDGKPVESIGGLHTQADRSLHEIDINQFDLLLISGGDGIRKIIEEEMISKLLKSSYELKIPIASICASAMLLAKAGVLKNQKFTCLNSTYENNEFLFENAVYVGTDIEIGEQIITAKGTAFAEFAIATAKKLGMLDDKKQTESILKFCKGISS